MTELEQVCDRLKIKAQVRYGNKVTEPDDWQQSANPYTVTLRFQGRRLTCDFFTGSGWTKEPNAADVLSSLVLDANCGDMTFEEFCQEFGYDEDSRKAERTWRQCKRMSPKVRQFLGEHLDEVANAQH